MTSDESAMALHDKATRGEALTAAELACLEEWYARQDQQEMAALANGPSAAPTLATLHAQVQTTLGRIQAVTQSVQLLLSENDQLRREIDNLQRQATPIQPTGPE
jgi:hypothetical protein